MLSNEEKASFKSWINYEPFPAYGRASSWGIYRNTSPFMLWRKCCIISSISMIFGGE